MGVGVSVGKSADVGVGVSVGKSADVGVGVGNRCEDETSGTNTGEVVTC